MLRMRMPEALYAALLTSAKSNKRRPQDHLIKCLAQTLDDPLTFDASQAAHLLSLQVISI